MSQVLPLILRRMRAPLLLLVGVYAICILGLVTVPGVAADGTPWRFDFFHAFYFVSFMGSTIGFGEIPQEFSGAQRLWTLVCIYLTVVAWVYAIGKILALVQDPALRRALQQWAFERSIRRIVDPFYIVCGYGATGKLLVRDMTRRGLQPVVVDQNPRKLEDLELDDLPMNVPYLCADARRPTTLELAGLTRLHCSAIITLAGDEHVNLKIAIAAELLNPRAEVISRAYSADTIANLKSFATDHIVNPLALFCDRLTLSMQSPAVGDIMDRILGEPGTQLVTRRAPPTGLWIICGYGRFGRTLHRYLGYQGVRVRIVDPDPAGQGAPEDSVTGRGTEAVTLREAGIADAAAVVAGTGDDANNLSIVVTARELRPDLFVVALQNEQADAVLFQRSRADRVACRHEICREHVLSLVTTPLALVFLRELRHRDNEFATELLAAMRSHSNEYAPATWTLRINRHQAPALMDRVREQGLSLGALLVNPRDGNRRLPLQTLMLRRDNELHVLPADDQRLVENDELLVCGPPAVKAALRWTQYHPKVAEQLPAGTPARAG